MRRIYKGFPLLLLLTLTGCDNQFSNLFWPEIEEEVCDDDTTSVTFKKVAYWSPDSSDYDQNEDNLDSVDFSTMSHIIYTSISVNSDGSLDIPEDEEEDILEALVSKAGNAGIEVGVSLGSGSDSNFNTIAESSSLTSDFVSAVEDLLDDYNLDGVEINWTSIGDDDESENLEELLDELEEDLSSTYFISMRLPSGEYSSADNIENDMFSYIDFANIEAFNSTNSDDLHSSMSDAEDAIAYWTSRCLIQNKLVLGVPFFSVDDDEDVSETLSYDEIVEDNTDYACTDESEGRNYNGIPTIVDKTSYALLYAGGIMMKSLEQDSYENYDYSLLNTVDQVSNGEYVDICY